MGFLERAFANPGRNHKRLEEVDGQLRATASRQTRARKRLEERVKALEAQLADQTVALDRLTRCLLQHTIIDTVQLDAILPRSTVQDD